MLRYEREKISANALTTLWTSSKLSSFYNRIIVRVCIEYKCSCCDFHLTRLISNDAFTSVKSHGRKNPYDRKSFAIVNILKCASFKDLG
jgi:hypothetical protein